MIGRAKSTIRGLLAGSSRGSTLAELPVNVAFLGIAVSLVGAGFFQALNIVHRWLVSAGFSRSGRTLGAEPPSPASGGETESKTLEAYAGMLQ